MLKFHQWAVWIAVTLVFASITNPARAQLTRGFISGTVTDASQAVVPGVLVSITNKLTGISRETVSTDAGFYRFVAIEPGTYSVEFKLAGFETRRIDAVTVTTAQEVTLNQALNIVGVTADVLVTETPGVELAKTNPTIERTFSERMLSDLPLTAARRDVTRLALLAPTVTRAPGSNEFSANGQRARNNNFIIDGVDNNDYTVTLNSARIIPESIQEVQVQTTAYSAEFGRSSGAQVSLVTRGGTNELHGQLWENYRGNWMEPVSLANKRAQINETPRFTVNQFGADGGGPIFTNRTFFFALLEKNMRREAPQASNAAPAIIPTPAGYALLSTIPLGPGQTLESRQAVLSALSFLQEVYPKVTNYDNLTSTNINGVAVPVGTIRIPIANPYDLWYTSARLDHKLTNKDSLTYRYHLDKRDEPNVTGNRQFGTKWSAAQTIFRQNHALSYTRTVSPRFLNEARLAYVRSNLDFPENDPITPTVLVGNVFTIGGSNAFPQGRLDHTWQYQDVATYTTGRNSLKFGLDLRRYWLSNRSQIDSKGTWSFGGLQDFLNNNATKLTQVVNDASFVAKQWNHAYFFQDDLKATRDLTLNLGIRYEYNTIPLGFFGATDPVIRAAGVRGPVAPDKNNWAPRFGFAYSPSNPKGLFAALLGAGKTSIRGGFGVAYDVLFYNIMANTATNYPRVVNSETTDNLNRFPTLALKIPTTVFNPLTPFTNASEDLQNPTTNFWTLSLQRELGSTVLEFGYTGNRSYHQIRQSQANPPILTAAQAATVLATGDTASIPGAQSRRLNPSWNSRTLIESAAKAEYHAGYVRLDKRFSHRLQFGANYTFSANFSDGDELISGVEDITLSSPAVPQDFFNFKNEWSRSVFDRPHRLVVHYIYDIPWFTSPWAAGTLNRIFGGWELAGFTEAQSGQPFTIRTGVDTVGTTAGGTNPPGRPNFNPGGTFYKDPISGDLRTFTIPLDGTGIVTAPLLANSMAGGGKLGRNTFRGPSFQQWNASLMKRIALKENLQIQLRSDFINIWNHNNFANPEARMSSPTFGRNTAKLISDAREMLFSAKVKF
jgi:Carboxypeptidase regulatory-like domain